MAGETLHSTEILNRILKLLQKKSKEEPKDVFRREPLPQPRDDSVNVYVRVSIIRVGNIDAVRQEFQCEFYMRLRWAETLLENKDIYEQDKIDWDSKWDPRYYFINSVRIDDHMLSREVQEPQFRGTVPQVIHHCRIIGTFKEVLDIKNFPFDYQNLSLILTSPYHADKLTFMKDEEMDDNVRSEFFYPVQEWTLAPHVLTEQLESRTTEGASPNCYPQYKIRMNVMRQYKFYFYNVFLIMFLITALTFVSFAVKADSIVGRIQLTLTLLLTSVAFKYNVQQFVPTVSYLTLIDKYLLTCMSFQFFMAVRNIISGFLPSSAMSLFECISLGIFLLGFMLINGYFLCLSLVYIKEAKSRMEIDKNEYIARNSNYQRTPDEMAEVPKMYCTPV